MVTAIKTNINSILFYVWLLLMGLIFLISGTLV
ncbi:MAG: hypothetical protein JWQ84_1377 [Mucilaginibacter sp.]|nr:hypothetical protein [Mucilaginibacter sp.]MDB5016545.1 hypothetical protein [Mucilaginibacter sp.]MDB5138504.1 hypothetical protein [Mucilaginibacter sp.]